MVEDKRARELVKELALEELEHKYTLEKAFLEEEIALHEAGVEEGPSMDLTMLLQIKPLDGDSSSQDVMIYAIACVGAPMEAMFRRLQQDEGKHLASLEELYESIYMPEM
jgi:rubrerythrin